MKYGILILVVCIAALVVLFWRTNGPEKKEHGLVLKSVEHLVPIARVGYIPTDDLPAYNQCYSWNPASGVAWDYGNVSIVIELENSRWVTKVIVVSDVESSREPKLRPDTVQIYFSQDNKEYMLFNSPYTTMRLTRAVETGKVWRVEFDGLGFCAKYIKLKQTYNGAEYGFGCKELAKCAQVFTDSSGLGKTQVAGLIAAPAQPEGGISAQVKVSSDMPGLVLELEAQNTESLEKVKGVFAYKADQWTTVSLKSARLKPGGYWLTVRLVFNGQLMAKRATCLRLYTGGDEALRHVVIDDVPSMGTGGTVFEYGLVNAPKDKHKGVRLAKGEAFVGKPPLSSEAAVYVAVGNPWPDLAVTWGQQSNTIPYTQEDWIPNDNVQELFIGFGKASDGPITVKAVGGEARIFHVRVVPLSAQDANLAHYVANPIVNRRVIYNNDGLSEFDGEKGWDKARLLQLVERYQGTDTAIFEMATIAPGWVNFPSKYATFLKPGDLPDDQWPCVNDKMAMELFWQLEQDGLPIFPTLAKRGREIGVPVWGSLRMTDWYQEQEAMHPLNSRLGHEHPEMRIRNSDGSYGAQMSFAWPEVQRQRLGVLGELLEMGCEGVMMDFCRYPEILGYDEPLVKGFQQKYGVIPINLPENDERWIRYRCDFMNDFFRAVRRQTDAIAAKQGRKLGISVRLPATGYREYGFDPQTWAREKLMDIFIPHVPCLERDFDVRPWVAMAKGTGILVYPGMEATKTQSSQMELTDAELKAGIKPGRWTRMTKDDYRRKAWRRYRNGADGMFLFNNWTMYDSRNLLGDKKALEQWSVFEDPMNLPRMDVVVSESGK
ncbi:MAG: family 10 glycosylhydrolase [Kiritimatiellaeota bacterium]|nr:family 10 glycosylhydrolase [Kiritimatiellota bacterium]